MIGLLGVHPVSKQASVALFTVSYAWVLLEDAQWPYASCPADCTMALADFRVPLNYEDYDTRVPYLAANRGVQLVLYDIISVCLCSQL